MIVRETETTTTNYYQVCTDQEGDDASVKVLLECVAQQFALQLEKSVTRSTMTTTNSSYDYENSGSSNENNEIVQELFLVLCSVLAFFMQAGFAMVCAGAVRKKNVRNTMMKNILDACGASIAFFSIGYAFAYGGDDPESPNKTFIGTENFFLMDLEKYPFFLFQYAFSAASATIVAGTLAERSQMISYLCYSVLLTGWVYPVVVHSIWSVNGFLSAYSIDPLWGVGMIDFSGSGVVHVTGGVTALFAGLILGPRRGRFHDSTGELLEKAAEFPGHSQALQMLGTFILWFGWYGFNCGTAITHIYEGSSNIAALAGVNTTLSAGMAGVTALLFNLFLLERLTGEPYFDLKYAMNGALCGLVSVTGGCGVIEPWSGLLIGFIAGIIYTLGSRLLVHLRIDDAVDAIPVHMMGGFWGVISVGLFASPRHLVTVYGHDNHPGLFYSWSNGDSDARLLGAQLVGLLFIVGWLMFTMLPFFVWLDWKGWFRSDPLEEIVGLDTSYHGALFLTRNEDESLHNEALEELRKRRSENGRRQGRSFGPTERACSDDRDCPDDDDDDDE